MIIITTRFEISIYLGIYQYLKKKAGLGNRDTYFPSWYPSVSLFIFIIFGLHLILDVNHQYSITQS